jgi:hypothetical protein
MAGVVDNNAAILRDSFTAHDAMIFVMDLIVRDVCNEGPERLEDGTIDYNFYMEKYREKLEAEAEQEDVAPAPEQEVPSEQPITSAEQADEGEYPEGAVVFGGDHGQTAEG